MARGVDGHGSGPAPGVQPPAQTLELRGRGLAKVGRVLGKKSEVVDRKMINDVIGVHISYHHIISFIQKVVGMLRFSWPSSHLWYSSRAFQNVRRTVTQFSSGQRHGAPEVFIAHERFQLPKLRFFVLIILDLLQHGLLEALQPKTSSC